MSPLVIVEYRWQISGIATPVVVQILIPTTLPGFLSGALGLCATLAASRNLVDFHKNAGSLRNSSYNAFHNPKSIARHLGSLDLDRSNFDRRYLFDVFDFAIGRPP